MPPTSPRALRLSDVLILVAATALGLAGCRFLLTHSETDWSEVWNGFRTGRTTRLGFVDLWLLAREGIRLASPLLLAWSAAVLVSRLRGPRPRRRRLWCQPGFLACLAVLLVHG